jgi:hypothetical protein
MVSGGVRIESTPKLPSSINITLRTAPKGHLPSSYAHLDMEQAIISIKDENDEIESAIYCIACCIIIDTSI